MAVTNLGRVGLVLKGNWSSATNYVKLDVVAYDGNSWVAKRSNTNVTPNTTNSDDWQLISNNADLVSTVQGYKNDAEAAAAAAALSASAGVDAIANEANAFSVTTNYAVGDYVIYDNGSHKYLYRFTSAHSAGSWVGTDAVQVPLANDVSALKNLAISMTPTIVLPGTYTALLPDLNNADDNKVYYVAMSAFSITSIPANMPYGIAVEPALLLTASTTSGSSYKVQLWITKTGIMTRIYASGAGWQPWTVIEKQTVTVSTASQLIRVVESGLPCNILLSANIELYAGYKAEKGNDYWDNYTGYSQTGDRNDSGLYLHPHVSFNGQQHVISFNPTTKTEAMMRDFAPFNLGGDNVLENVIIDIGNRNCRYAIHDDFAIATEGEIIRNVTMKGTGVSPALLGAGVKPNCSYVVENCLCQDNAGDCDILYHSSTQNVQAASFLTIRNCYCEKDINIKYVGTNQVVTPCLVTGCHARAITLSAGSGETPYQNMNLISWNNEVGV
jgi:hypothetical protein